MTTRGTPTPGPWKWFDYPDGRKILVAPERSVIHCPDAPMEVDPPDAHLIAAAPELLEALKDAQVGVCSEYCSDSYHVLSCRKACAALAKAEGSTPTPGEQG